MRTLLSLDLGVTNGWAVLNLDGPLEDCIVESGSTDLALLERWLTTLLILRRPRWSVAEKPVIIRGPLGDQMHEAISITERVLSHQVEMWTPSQWKPHPLAKTPLPRGLTPHERDAIRLGFVYRARVVEKLLSNH